MAITRRHALGLTAGASALMLAKFSAFAQTGQITGVPFFIGQNEIIIRPINHASLVLSINGTTIYVDPVGPQSRYAGLPPADLILVTHHHDDHFDKPLLSKLAEPGTPLVTNSVVSSRLPAAIKNQASSLKNGEFTTYNDIKIDAVPAYNLTQDRQQFHPKGRDNGYILSIGSTRIYLAGDTEDIPEMRALSNIDLAFIPMILPWTMDPAQAASAVNEFAPKTVYPYHYGTSNIFNFKDLVEASAQDITVQLFDWYNQASS